MFLAAAAAAAPVEASLVPAAEIEVAGRALRLGDVARLSGGTAAERARFAGVVVARLPEGRSGASLDREALAGLIERRVAGVTVVGAAAQGPLVVRLRPASAAPAGSCFALARPLHRGEALAADAVEEAPCPAERAVAALRFDRRAGLARAAAELPAGTALGRLHLAEAAAIEPGAELTLESAVGPVRITRPVTAIQPGRAGRGIFVRDRDGTILAVRVAATTEGAR